jgi:hypothetical protein
LFWANKYRLVKTVPMDIEVGIPQMHKPIKLIHKELTRQLPKPQQHLT